MVQQKIQEVVYDDDKEKSSTFCINDNMDVLIEILKRVDDRSLGVAACVCRLWCSITRNDSLWEHLCFRHVSPPPHGVKTVVLALGGYKKLYMVCVKPVLSRLGRLRIKLGACAESESDRVTRIWWIRQELELSLSLFSTDYYERVILSGGGTGSLGGESPSTVSSLAFLCKAVNV